MIRKRAFRWSALCISSFRFSPSRSVIFKEACSVPRRSAIPVASNCSDSGFRTENLSEELPQLITSMSEEEVGTERRLAELNPLSQSYAIRVGEASSVCPFREAGKARTLRLHIATLWAATSWLFFRAGGRRTRPSRIDLGI